MDTEQYLLTKIHPLWLDTRVPLEYEDESLYEIILFFVIHSPCDGQSARRISLSDRGWKKNPWYSPSYLKDKIDNILWGDGKKQLKMVMSKADMLHEAERFNLKDNFFKSRKQQRALFVKSSAKNCSSEYMSLFYHIRNALAHGRIAMYPIGNNDIVFVMEDGSIQKEMYQVSARIVIRKSSLLKIINLLKNPPIENDYTDDILSAIKNGCNTKKAIIRELSIDEKIYKQYTHKLKSQGLIEFKNQTWCVVN